jgi:hypothetical protein
MLLLPFRLPVGSIFSLSAKTVTDFNDSAVLDLLLEIGKLDLVFEAEAAYNPVLGLSAVPAAILMRLLGTGRDEIELDEEDMVVRRCCDCSCCLDGTATSFSSEKTLNLRMAFTQVDHRVELCLGSRYIVGVA